MIVHTVTMRFARPIDDSARDRVLAAVRDFGAVPPHALGPADVEQDAGLRPEGRSVSELLMRLRFEDAGSFAAYLEHPDHVRLVAEVLAPNLESWLSIQVEQ